jgi:hypothetical protein
MLEHDVAKIPLCHIGWFANPGYQEGGWTPKPMAVPRTKLSPANQNGTIVPSG